LKLPEWLNSFLYIKVSPNRIQGLDVYRAGAILMVLMAHCIYFFGAVLPKVYGAFFLFNNGVEAFFVLSGFLIGGILFRLYQSEGQVGYNFLKQFYKKRWFKTLPVYFLVIVIHLLLGYFVWGGLLQNFNWKFLFFIQNIYSGAFYFFPVSYSLSIEEWFYLLLPLALLVVQILWRKFSFSKALLVVAVLFIIIFNCARAYNYQHGINLNWDANIRKAILMRLDAPMYGVVMAWIWNKNRELLLQNKVRCLILGGILYVLTILIKRFIYPESFYSYVLYFTLVPVSFALAIPWFYNFKFSNAVLSKLSTYISLVSYSFYAIHLSPILFLFLHFWQPATIAEASSECIVYLIIAWLFTHILYKYFEKPVMDLRDKI
jgi:peptidoglycan/LPS O-acetylase OafA/YrhL